MKEETMEFQVRYCHTARWEAIRRRALHKRDDIWRKLMTWFIRIGLLLLGGDFLVFSVLALVQSGFHPLALLYIPLGVLALLWGLFAGRLSAGFSALVNRRLFRAGETFTFGRDQMEISNGTTVSGRVPYDRLIRAVEAPDCYVLCGKKTAYLLPKDAFLAGDPEAFPAFLRKKLGKPLETMK